jgi:hypothetical protein
VEGSIIHVFTKLFIQICRALLIFTRTVGKSADFPGILEQIPVNDKTGLTRSEVLKRLRASLRFNKYDEVPQLECPAPKMRKKVLE